MHTSRTSTVFLVDDHPVVRLGYTLLLDTLPHIEITGEAESGVEALEKLLDRPPDLAIVDISLEDMNGIELTRELTRRLPDVKILIVSAHTSATYARQALNAGASGYIVKNKAADFVSEAIDKVLSGEHFICPEMAEKLGPTDDPGEG